MAAKIIGATNVLRLCCDFSILKIRSLDFFVSFLYQDINEKKFE